MRLTCIFIAFLLGLLCNHPQADGFGPVIAIPGIVSGLAVLFIPGISRRFKLVSVAYTAFFAGLLWIEDLPTWKGPIFTGTENPLVELEGIAIAEPLDTPSGRYLPLSVKSLTFYQESSASHSINSVQAEKVNGIILAKIGRSVSTVTGGRYIARGKLISDLDELTSPIVLRHRPRGILELSIGNNSIQLIRSPGLFYSSISRLRFDLTNHLAWGLNDSNGQLSAGIVLGRKGRHLGSGWTGDFYSAGLSHLIVASGAQISLLFFPLFFLMGRVALNRNVRWLLIAVIILSLFGFVRILGGEPSILRASVMGVILLISIGLRKQSYGMAALSAAGLYWLIQNPMLSRDTGFLLSIAASFGIIYICPVLVKIIPMPYVGKNKSGLKSRINIVEFIGNLKINIARLFLLSSIITTGAQLGVFPVLAATVGRLSLAGFISNLIAVPVGQIILFLGAFSGLLGFISPKISVLLNHLIGIFTSILMVTANLFGSIPFANARIHPIPGFSVLIYYLILIALVESYRYGIFKVKTVKDGIKSEGFTTIDISEQPLPF
jgi:ComEC/Rec2-related protein